MNLEACLPIELQRPTTTITRIARGLSGAGVYRVDAGGRALVLKISADDEPIERWQSKLAVQRLAADAGVAPRVVHADEDRRAILSELVVDRGFVPFYMPPTTRARAIAMLARTVRAVHDVPLPADLETRTTRDLLEMVWRGLAAFPLPPFVAGAATRMHAEPIPSSGRAPVLSHNDINPSNLAFDGERIVLLDWDTAGANDPYSDLAALAVFLRMDEPTALALLAAYDGAPVPALPPRFAYCRRLVAVACGVIFLHLARTAGHGGSTTPSSIADTPSCADCHAQMRAGTLAIGSPDGQWTFGLALVRESFAL